MGRGAWRRRPRRPLDSPNLSRPLSADNVVIRGLCLSACVATAGCVTTIRPPADPQDPVEVGLIDYGYHAGLVLPTADGGSVEYAYGEWEWFARNNDAWYRVFPALCWPTSGALGRRPLPAVERLAKAVAAEEILVFQVGRREAAALLDRLGHRYASRSEAPHPNPAVGLTFVPDDASYCCFANCNTALAGWLRELGCEVSGPACSANFRIVR